MYYIEDSSISGCSNRMWKNYQSSGRRLSWDAVNARCREQWFTGSLLLLDSACAKFLLTCKDEHPMVHNSWVLLRRDEPALLAVSATPVELGQDMRTAVPFYYSDPQAASLPGLIALLRQGAVGLPLSECATSPSALRSKVLAVQKYAEYLSRPDVLDRMARPRLSANAVGISPSLTKLTVTGTAGFGTPPAISASSWRVYSPEQQQYNLRPWEMFSLNNTRYPTAEGMMEAMCGVLTRTDMLYTVAGSMVLSDAYASMRIVAHYLRKVHDLGGHFDRPHYEIRRGGIGSDKKRRLYYAPMPFYYTSPRHSNHLVGACFFSVTQPLRWVKAAQFMASS